MFDNSSRVLWNVQFFDHVIDASFYLFKVITSFSLLAEDVCWGIRNVKSLIKVLQHTLCCHVCNRSLWIIYAVPRQIKPGILKLTVKTGQCSFGVAFIFVILEEKGSYRVVSARQLGYDCRSYYGRSNRVQRLTQVRRYFSKWNSSVIPRQCS